MGDRVIRLTPFFHYMNLVFNVVVGAILVTLVERLIVLRSNLFLALLGSSLSLCPPSLLLPSLLLELLLHLVLLEVVPALPVRLLQVLGGGRDQLAQVLLLERGALELDVVRDLDLLPGRRRKKNRESTTI